MSFPVDEVIDDVQKVPRKIVNRLRVSASLKPSVATMDAYCAGHPAAKTIIESWRFKENRATKIRVVSREEFQAMIQKAGL